MNPGLAWDEVLKSLGGNYLGHWVGNLALWLSPLTDDNFRSFLHSFFSLSVFLCFPRQTILIWVITWIIRINTRSSNIWSKNIFLTLFYAKFLFQTQKKKKNPSVMRWQEIFYHFINWTQNSFHGEKSFG